MEINNLERFLEKVNSGRTAIGGLVSFTDKADTEKEADAGID